MKDKYHTLHRKKPVEENDYVVGHINYKLTHFINSFKSRTK